MAREGLGQTPRFLHGYKAREALADEGCGFALRKSWQRRGEQAWRQMLTTYRPEPWLVALARDRLGLPVKPGHRPIANR
jgi:hypothetical protein